MQLATKNNSKSQHITKKLIAAAKTTTEKARTVSTTTKQYSELQNCLVTVDGDTAAFILGYN